MTNNEYAGMTITELENELNYVRDDVSYFEDRLAEAVVEFDALTGELNRRASNKRAKSSRKIATKNTRNRTTKRTR